MHLRQFLGYALLDNLSCRIACRFGGSCCIVCRFLGGRSVVGGRLCSLVCIAGLRLCIFSAGRRVLHRLPDFGSGLLDVGSEVKPADILGAGLDAVVDRARSDATVPLVLYLALAVDLLGADRKLEAAFVCEGALADQPVKLDTIAVSDDAVDGVLVRLLGRVFGADLPCKAHSEVVSVHDSAVDAEMLPGHIMLTGHAEGALALGHCNFSCLGVDYDWFCHGFTSYQ